MAELVALKYCAFISYSHVDASWAKWLHRGLETFRIDKDLVDRETAMGAIPRTLRPIFRDRDDLTAGHTLTEQVLAALDASRALIVICSPSSAKSRYVTEEIRLFKTRHPERPVIPLIVGGKPGDPELECFPLSLKFKLDTDGQTTNEPTELLAADAREEGDGKNLAIAKVTAGLLGLSSDEVFRRAERERRAATRRKHRVQALVGGLVLLLVAGGVGWLNQKYLKEQYYWLAVMGPTLLTAEKERALQPGDNFRECTLCPLMVAVPAGKFMMGSQILIGETDEHPQHEVMIAKPFAIAKYQVTFAEWDMCVATGDCPHVPDGGWGHGERPVINVSWDDAKQYVAWLSRLTGKTYRLLTEAEWEYAARAGTTTLYSFGDDVAELQYYAWYTVNSDGKTHPVGEKKPNAFGLYDMHGNVSEWVEDPWHGNYNGAPSDGSAWVEGGDPSWHVLRGSNWVDAPELLRSASRNGFNTGGRRNDFGFRVGRTLTP
jgi:formylglycine-generating enzyme required for sulfatase activity